MSETDETKVGIPPGLSGPEGWRDVLHQSIDAALSAAKAETAERCAKIADDIAKSVLAQEAWDPDDENYDMEAYEEAEYAASVAGSVASAIRKGFLS